jgi:hypothetical protein
VLHQRVVDNMDVVHGLPLEHRAVTDDCQRRQAIT